MVTRRVAVETFRHFRIATFSSDGRFRALISRVDGTPVHDLEGRLFNDFSTITCDTGEEAVLRARRMIDSGELR